jgi:hypothetical protein
VFFDTPEIVLTRADCEIFESRRERSQNVRLAIKFFHNAACANAVGIIRDFHMAIAKVARVAKYVACRLWRRKYERAAWFHHARYLASVIIKSRARINVVAGVTCQNIIEGLISKWNVSISSDAGRDINAETCHSRCRKSADFIRDLDPIYAHAEVMQKRHVPSVAEADVEHFVSGIFGCVRLKSGIVPQESANNELHRVHVDRIAKAIKAIIGVY